MLATGSCWCVLKVYCYHFQGWTKYIWTISMLKLPNFAQQNCLFLKKEIYLAGCELHIQTLLFLIILTLKQYVNTKTIWGSEVRNISCHDDYYQPLMTYMASIPAHSWSFFKEAGFFRNDHFTPGLQSVFYADCSNHWTRLISRITNAKVWVICWSQETRSVFFFAAAKCHELSTV